MGLLSVSFTHDMQNAEEDAVCRQITIEVITWLGCLLGDVPDNGRIEARGGCILRCGRRVNHSMIQEMKQEHAG